MDEKKWFECDDESISTVDKQDLISKNSFILFYKRKELHGSTVVNLSTSFN